MAAVNDFQSKKSCFDVYVDTTLGLWGNNRGEFLVFHQG
jgi:hypothetical protein